MSAVGVVRESVLLFFDGFIMDVVNVQEKLALITVTGFQNAQNAWFEWHVVTCTFFNKLASMMLPMLLLQLHQT